MMNGKLGAAFSEFLLALLSRILIQPLGWFVPRDGGLWVVLGREHGRYLDNAKYFHAWLCGNLPRGQRVVFVGERRDELACVAAAGASVARYPGWRACGLLLRAGTVVCDSADVLEHGRTGFIAGARRVQIWHGVPLKEIELPLHRRRLASIPAPLRLALRSYKAVIGRHEPWDVLISTSEYLAERAFVASIPAHSILVSGYPRNDALTGADGYPSALLEIGVDREARRRLEAHRVEGRRVVLYAPTFRSEGGSPFDSGHVDLAGLSRFAERHNVLFALKLHPVMAGRYSVDAYPGVVEIAAASDVYPLLPLIDLLITDYSSIYFDYLLLDRPLVFYPYDLAAYIADDRRLLFDYEEMTPGPKAHDFLELLTVLDDVLSARTDVWADRRQYVRRLAFDIDGPGSARRLCEALAGGVRGCS
jgi:CDP-glycerol glycerophosphotransferase